jgi:tetratricopeptide (TPR) repeat protein
MDKKTSELTLEHAREAHERWLIKKNQKDLDKAIEYYSKTLVSNPNLSECHYRLAMLLWENGQIGLTTAINKCKLAMTVSPKNINAHIYAGYFLKIAEKYNEAEREFKNALNISPFFSSRARLNLGLLNAEKLFSSSFNLSSFIKSGYYLFTGFLFSIFDYPCVRMGLQKIKESCAISKYVFTGQIFKLLGLDKKAVKTYRMARVKTGRSEIFSKLIGDIDVKHENINDALLAYENVLKITPTDRESLLKKATILQTYFDGREKEAIDAYTKALSTIGTKDYIYYELGHLYLKINDIINAINAFKLAVAEDNTNAYFHNALGCALFAAGQYDEAEDHYLVAINLNPDDEWTSTVCRATALIYSDIKHNKEKAIRMYMQALALDKNSYEAYTSLGDLYFDEEDYDKALEYYSKSIEIYSYDYSVFNKLATTLWQKEYVEEAIIAYRHAIDLNPEYSAVYNNLGVIYLDGKNLLSEAKDCFEVAIEKNSEYTMAYYNAARAYEADNDKITAAKYYQRAYELNMVKPEISSIDIQEKIYALFD